MNLPKLLPMLKDYNECVGLLWFCYRKNDHRNFANILRYLDCLDKDINKIMTPTLPVARAVYRIVR